MTTSNTTHLYTTSSVDVDINGVREDTDGTLFQGEKDEWMNAIDQMSSSRPDPTRHELV